MAKMTFWVLATGCIWLLLLTIPHLALFTFADVTVSTWVGVAYLAIFTTVITFFLTQFATIRLGSTTVMSYSYLYPPFVVIIELLLGHGLPDPRTWPGMLLILLALLVIQRKKGSISSS